MKNTAKLYHLKRSYGLSESDVLEMIDVRNSQCDICKEVMVKPNVDHCHSTGRIRGMLCWNCNTGLGKFRDNIDYLNNAIAYLEEK